MKISFLRISLLAVTILVLSACTAMQKGEKESTAGQPAFEQAYQEAEAALKKAAATNNLWVATEDNLNEAKEAATKGDFETALKLAKKAKFESDAAYEQGESQKNAKSWLF